MNDEYSVRLVRNGCITEKHVKYTGEEFLIRLYIFGGLHPDCVKFYYGNDEKVISVKKLSPVYDSNDDLYYEAEFNESTAGLYFFHFEIDTGGERRYTVPDQNCFARQFSGEEQLLCADNIYGTSFNYRGGIIYHIFVDRFFKYGEVPCREDAELDPDWDNGVPEYAEEPGGFLKNNRFFGGTLYGIAQKLDYLMALGTEIICLTPIFRAYSNHKYDVGDFMSVDEMFGGGEALLQLIDGCKKRNMKLILDGVFNHVGDDSLYFNRHGKYPSKGAYLNVDSPYREWFNINENGYDCWWGLENLPKINKTQSYRDFICNTVIPHYMSMGIDGWRLDVVDEYDNTFLEEIVSSIKKADPGAIVIGEVWDDVSNKIAYDERKSYFYGRSLDSAMNYPLREALIGFIKNKNSRGLFETVKTQIKHYPAEKQLMMMNFLGTHDTERISTVLGGKNGEGKKGSELALMSMDPVEKEKSKKLFQTAYKLLAALPGIPSVYYGDETGMEGYRDPFNRKPFPWNSLDIEACDYVREVNLMRESTPALLYGETELLDVPDGVFAFKRIYKENETVCVCNMSESAYLFKGKSFSINIQPGDILII